MGNILKKIGKFIGKDTKAKNESKKTTVVIRNIIISILVYFCINAIIGNAAKDMRNIIFFIFFIVFLVGMFACTYYFRTTTVLWMFNAAMLVFIVTILVFFGWNVGVQHFLMVMLLLYFFSGYKRYKEKFLFAALLCALRFLLFSIFHDRAPLLPISASAVNILQAVNTVAIFWCLSLIAYFFSKDSQELEGKLVQYNEQLEKLANTDKLTGLFNRRKAWDYLEKIAKEKSECSGFSLCICDIDFFKKVNDQYGHDVGDEVLKNVAGIFMEEMKGKNLAARWGGEEFLLLFPDCNGDDAYVKLEHIGRKIKDMRVGKEDAEIGITMTFGLAEYDYSGELEDTIKEADRKLYQGKEQGRDRIIY